MTGSAPAFRWRFPDFPLGVVADTAITKLRPIVSRIRRHDRVLAKQLTDAANSVVLNIGEGAHIPDSVEHTTRYFLSGSPQSRLLPKQWLLVIRRHWAVETTHQILDTAFKEDDEPWITSHPRGAAVLMMLRRIAYALLTFFLNVTLRSDDSRAQPWKTLMRSMDIALLTATAADLTGLRKHPAPS